MPAPRTPEQQRTNYERWYRKLLNEIFDHYGRECVCCGESEPLFLTIDHVGSDGASKRREAGTTAGKNYYIKIRKAGFPPGYQTLCVNCNLGRARNGGVCPHKT